MSHNCGGKRRHAACGIGLLQQLFSMPVDFCGDGKLLTDRHHCVQSGNIPKPDGGQISIIVVSAV